MSPARAAVLWDVLVADVGQVVDTVDVVPQEGLWKVVHSFEWGVDSGWTLDSTVSVAWHLRVNSSELLFCEGNCSQESDGGKESHMVDGNSRLVCNMF